MKKSLYVLAAAFFAAGALTACGGNNKETTAGTTTAAVTESKETESAAPADETAAEAGELKKLVVGASPAPHAEILKAAKDILKEKGYDLVIKEYTDYVQPNLALESGDLDANYFQHFPYLEQFNQENGTDLVSAGAIHYEPFGIYAGKTASLADLADGAQVAVPNDVSNEARALLLLEENGIITLKEDAGLNATKKDVEKNPHNIEIVELDAAQIARVVEELDFVILNGNYALDAGFNVQTDAIAKEEADSEAAQTYANIIAVKKENKDSEKIKALVEVLQSEEIGKFITDTYEGAVVPMK